MNITEFASRIASIVDLELFQNQCGMIYFDQLSSQSIAQKLGTKLKKQNVNFEYVHAKNLLKSQRMLDQLGLSTDLKVVYGFEDLTCFFDQCLDAVLNPSILELPNDFNILSNSEFKSKYNVGRNSVMDFVDIFNQLININFEKALTKDQSIASMFLMNKHDFAKALTSFESLTLSSNQEGTNLSLVYGLCASCYIQGLNFRPFSKIVIILPQQLAKIIYEFMPYKGLFENCKDGYGVMGLNSSYGLLTTFGSRTSFQGPIDVIIDQYQECLDALNTIQEVYPNKI